MIFEIKTLLGRKSHCRGSASGECLENTGVVLFKPGGGRGKRAKSWRSCFSAAHWQFQKFKKFFNSSHTPYLLCRDIRALCCSAVLLAEVLASSGAIFEFFDGLPEMHVLIPKWVMEDLAIDEPPGCISSAERVASDPQNPCCADRGKSGGGIGGPGTCRCLKHLRVEIVKTNENPRCVDGVMSNGIGGQARTLPRISTICSGQSPAKARACEGARGRAGLGHKRIWEKKLVGQQLEVLPSMATCRLQPPGPFSFSFRFL